MKIRRWILVTLAALTVVGCIPKKKATSGPGATTRRDPNDGKVVIAAPEAKDNTAPPDPTNPFYGTTFFLNPEYVKEVEDAAAASPANAETIKKVAANPTATWLVMNSFVAKVPKVLDLAAKQASADGKPILSAFVVYNLPNRDCAAKSSSGELTVANNGEQLYRTEFIDKIAAQFAKYPKQRIVVFLEPDSLPNLVTNLNQKRCAEAEQAYKNSMAYAISKLSMPNVAIYLDIGHAGWLGWDGNRTKTAKLYQSVLAQAGMDKVRGFVTNIANYNTVASRDGAKLGPSNPCPDELSYVRKLNESFNAIGVTGKKFIIDTSRNGRPVRYTWGSWCNVKGAGLGPRPQISPDPLIDAYFWIKPPGESDGTSDPNAARADEACRRDDSMPNAPEAGEWFQSYFLELVKNAEPAL